MPRARCLPLDEYPLEYDPSEELLASLNRINTFNPPVQTCSTGWTFSGLYSGPTSIACLFFRLYKIYPALTFKSQSLEDWAISYLQLGSSYLLNAPNGRTSVSPTHCGVTNETLAQLSIRAAIYEDASLVQQLCSYSSIINHATAGADDWLHGRAGYLYLLRLARSAFPVPSYQSIHSLVSRTMSTTATRILSAQESWEQPNDSCIDPIHGTAGTLTQLLLSSPDPTDLLNQLTSLIEGFLSDASIASHSGSAHTIPQATLSLQPLSKLLNAHFPLSASSHTTFLQTLSPITSASLEADKVLMTDAGRKDTWAGLHTGEAGRAWVWCVAERMLARKRSRDGHEAKDIEWEAAALQEGIEMGMLGFSDL